MDLWLTAERKNHPLRENSRFSCNEFAKNDRERRFGKWFFLIEWVVMGMWKQPKRKPPKAVNLCFCQATKGYGTMCEAKLQVFSGRKMRKKVARGGGGSIWSRWGKKSGEAEEEKHPGSVSGR
jgi:hypothetical protein